MFDEATLSIGVNVRQITAYHSEAAPAGRNPLVVRSSIPPSDLSARDASSVDSE